MIAVLLFVAQHAALLVLLFATSAATGTAVLGPRAPLALRATLGLAVAGQAFLLLAGIGALRPWSIAVLVAGALIAGAARMEWRVPHWPAVAAMTAITVPLFSLALYPPLAFDETLYHLPFIEAMAESGALRLLPSLRFPIFPELHEALGVPGFLALGDVAPHLIGVTELVLLAALLMAWMPGRAGLVAAALLLGNPILVHLATITYVESSLILFVTAGFFCLDRATEENETTYVLLSGFFLGTACSVKYLGACFALAALIWVLLTGPNRRRRALLFFVALVAAMAPTHALIVGLTGNPVFPFQFPLGHSSPWLTGTEQGNPLIRTVRLFWDWTFARGRLNQQPPVSPFIAITVLITIVAARRDRRAAFLCALFASYIALFILFLPADARYLVPLLPLAVIAAGPWISRWRALAVVMSSLSLAAGLAYVVYRLVLLGPVPTNPEQRRQFLERRIPEYRALERRGPGRIYVCVAEQLQYFGHGELSGDWTGPLAYEEVFGGRDARELSLKLSSHGLRYLLVSQRCPPAWAQVPAGPFFERVYADEGAVLWRVVPPLPTDS